MGSSEAPQFLQGNPRTYILSWIYWPASGEAIYCTRAVFTPIVELARRATNPQFSNFFPPKLQFSHSRMKATLTNSANTLWTIHKRCHESANGAMPETETKLLPGTCWRSFHRERRLSHGSTFRKQAGFKYYIDDLNYKLKSWKARTFWWCDTEVTGIWAYAHFIS